MAKWPAKWFLIGAVTLVIEFALKYAAWMYRHEQELINVPPYVSMNIVYVENRHSAFSMMRGFPQWVNYSLLAVSIVFLIGITYQQVVAKNSTVIMRRGVFCFIIGAIGNLVDRILLDGAVVDYIDIRLGEDGSYYALAWNISDLVINLGFAHVMYESIRGVDEEAEHKKTDGGSGMPTPEKEPKASPIKKKFPLVPVNKI
jgi:lipoprotein signal peptidase